MSYWMIANNTIYNYLYFFFIASLSFISEFCIHNKYLLFLLKTRCYFKIVIDHAAEAFAKKTYRWVKSKKNGPCTAMVLTETKPSPWKTTHHSVFMKGCYNSICFLWVINSKNEGKTGTLLKYVLTYLVTLYLWHSTLLGPLYKKKIDCEEKKFNQRFDECSLFLHGKTQ